MSRAFIREETLEQPAAAPAPAPDVQPNYVTPRGLALLQARVAAAQARAAEGDMQAREWRQLAERLERARLVDPARQPADRVTFGVEVVVADEDGQRYRYRIVGEDEVAPAHGRVSWRSPLARALLGARVGDLVGWNRPAGVMELEVLSISNTPEPEDAA